MSLCCTQGMACSEAENFQLVPKFPLVMRGKIERLASLASCPSLVLGDDSTPAT